ncbi:MAG: hypothetical protein LBD33_01770 [Puniceicoccales bacterium]|nr:hypothetical protein [Puniceicoccales bacterium]
MRLRNALMGLAIDNEFSQYSWQVGVFLRYTNNAIESFCAQNVQLQAANDQMRAADANERTALNIRVGSGVFIGGGVGGLGAAGAVGLLLGSIVGPPGALIGGAIGGFVGGVGGGVVAHMTAAKR